MLQNCRWPFFACACAVLSLAVATANSDDPIPKPPADVPMTTSPIETALDSRTCQSCHERELPQYIAQRTYELIPKDPYVTWKGPDPHSKAYEVLLPKPENVIAARMRQSLGEQIHERNECLTCHAVDHQPASPLDKKTFAWSSGVGCEACHGVADRWFQPHVLIPWRRTPPTGPDSKDSLGLVDLRDPTVRAAKCASCHVGNADEGKFVTHAMYAAGHPPLLPFEAATFYRDQPAHGLLPENTPYFQKPDPGIDVAKLFHYRPGENSTARSLAVGALVNLRESARLIAAGAATTKDGDTLDFAHFDCFACHHELELPSARQQRGYVNVAGRPPLRPLPTELVEAVLAHAATQGQAAGRVNQMNDAVTALNLAATNQPFGDSTKVAGAAEKLQKWAGECLNDLNGVKYTDESVRGLCERLTAEPAKPWDYDAAQVMAWSARALIAEPPDAKWNDLSRFVYLNAGIPKGMTVGGVSKDRLLKRHNFAPQKFRDAWDALGQR